jgi:predicted ATPase
LGTALLATHGYTSPLVAQAYHRVQELAQQVPDTPEVFQALWGLYQFHSVRGEHLQARRLAEYLLALAHHTHDPVCLVVGYYAVGGTGYYLGEFATSCDVLGQAQACYERHQHHTHLVRYGVDVGVVCGSFLPWPLWCLGYPERALRTSQAALTLAEALAHPYSVAIAWARLGQVHRLRREAQATQACAETLITLATAQGFPHYVILGRSLHDWALAVQSGEPRHLTQYRQSIASQRARGIHMAQAQKGALLAELHTQAQQVPAGLETLAEAWALVQQTGEVYYAAELDRLQGELLRQRDGANTSQAQTCLQQALDIARQQQAKSWELRAATSLSRLWQQQGKRAEAYALLAPIYAWFTEGFDSADLQEAKELLEELGREGEKATMVTDRPIVGCNSTSVPKPQ